jgi:hypothetical protein
MCVDSYRQMLVDIGYVEKTLPIIMEYCMNNYASAELIARFREQSSMLPLFHYALLSIIENLRG